MLEIKYVRGDATLPQGDGNKIICHICNDVGAWGAGFVLAISKRWATPEIAYRTKKKHSLGQVDFIRVNNETLVANMIAQRGISFEKNIPPINYSAVKICLNIVNDMAFSTSSTVHMPRIGTGLAGGNWDDILKIIEDTMSVNVIVYDYIKP